MLDEASRQVLVETGIGLFGKDGVDAVWTGSEGTVRWNGNLERDKGAGAKFFLDVEKTSGNSQGTSPKVLMTAGGQPQPWRLNLVSRRCKGSRSQMWRKLTHCLSFNRSRSFEQGVFGGDGASVGEIASVAAGMLSCRA